MERSAKYYGTNVEVMEIYCSKYMHTPRLTAPARFLPDTAVYKKIIKKIGELEQTQKAELRVSKIKKLTELIKSKK